MNPSDILLKPVLSEKATKQQDKKNTFTFKVAKGANKIEIKKAIEIFYNVKVDSVRTLVIPGKVKNRSTKKRFITGSTSSFKKALVKLSDGETIDLFSNI